MFLRLGSSLSIPFVFLSLHYKIIFVLERKSEIKKEIDMDERKGEKMKGDDPKSIFL